MLTTDNQHISSSQNWFLRMLLVAAQLENLGGKQNVCEINTILFKEYLKNCMFDCVQVPMCAGIEDSTQHQLSSSIGPYLFLWDSL